MPGHAFWSSAGRGVPLPGMHQLELPFEALDGH
jgi:hypothetical protein